MTPSPTTPSMTSETGMSCGESGNSEAPPSGSHDGDGGSVSDLSAGGQRNSVCGRSAHNVESIIPDGSVDGGVDAYESIHVGIDEKANGTVSVSIDVDVEDNNRGSSLVEFACCSKMFENDYAEQESKMISDSNCCTGSSHVSKSQCSVNCDGRAHSYSARHGQNWCHGNETDYDECGGGDNERDHDAISTSNSGSVQSDCAGDSFSKSASDGCCPDKSSSTLDSCPDGETTDIVTHDMNKIAPVVYADERIVLYGCDEENKDTNVGYGGEIKSSKDGGAEDNVNIDVCNTSSDKTTQDVLATDIEEPGDACAPNFDNPPNDGEDVGNGYQPLTPSSQVGMKTGKYVLPDIHFKELVTDREAMETKQDSKNGDKMSDCQLPESLQTPTTQESHLSDDVRDGNLLSPSKFASSHVRQVSYQVFNTDDSPEKVSTTNKVQIDHPVNLLTPSMNSSQPEYAFPGRSLTSHEPISSSTPTEPRYQSTHTNQPTTKPSKKELDHGLQARIGHLRNQKHPFSNVDNLADQDHLSPIVARNKKHHRCADQSLSLRSPSVDSRENTQGHLDGIWSESPIEKDQLSFSPLEFDSDLSDFSFSFSKNGALRRRLREDFHTADQSPASESDTGSIAGRLISSRTRLMRHRPSNKHLGRKNPSRVGRMTRRQSFSQKERQNRSEDLHPRKCYVITETGKVYRRQQVRETTSKTDRFGGVYKKQTISVITYIKPRSIKLRRQSCPSIHSSTETDYQTAEDESKLASSNPPTAGRNTKSHRTHQGTEIDPRDNFEMLSRRVIDSTSSSHSHFVRGSKRRPESQEEEFETAYEDEGSMSSPLMNNKSVNERLKNGDISESITENFIETGPIPNPVHDDNQGPSTCDGEATMSRREGNPNRNGCTPDGHTFIPIGQSSSHDHIVNPLEGAVPGHILDLRGENASLNPTQLDSRKEQQPALKITSTDSTFDESSSVSTQSRPIANVEQVDSTPQPSPILNSDQSASASSHRLVDEPNSCDSDGSTNDFYNGLSSMFIFDPSAYSPPSPPSQSLAAANDTKLVPDSRPRDNSPLERGAAPTYPLDATGNVSNDELQQLHEELTKFQEIEKRRIDQMHRRGREQQSLESIQTQHGSNSCIHNNQFLPTPHESDNEGQRDGHVTKSKVRQNQGEQQDVLENSQVLHFDVNECELRDINTMQYQQQQDRESTGRAQDSKKGRQECDQEQSVREEVNGAISIDKNEQERSFQKKLRENVNSLNLKTDRKPLDQRADQLESTRPQKHEKEQNGESGCQYLHAHEYDQPPQLPSSSPQLHHQQSQQQQRRIRRQEKFRRQISKQWQNQHHRRQPQQLVQMGFQPAGHIDVQRQIYHQIQRNHDYYNHQQRKENQKQDAQPPPPSKEQETQKLQPREQKAQQIQPKQQKAQELQPEEPKAQQFKPEEPKAQQLQPGEPKAQQLQPKEQKAQKLQPGEPKAQQLQPGEQTAQQFKLEEPKAQQFKPKESKAQQLQPGEQKAQQFKPEEPKAQQLQPGEQKAQQIQSTEQKAQQFKPKEQKAQQFKPKEQKAQQLQSKDQKAQQLQPKEQKAQQLQSREQETQQLQPKKQKGQKLQPKNQKAQQLQPKEQKAQQLQPKQQKAKQSQPKEQKAQQLQSTEQEAQQLHPKEQNAQQLHPKEQKAQQLQPKEPKAQKSQPKEPKAQKSQPKERKAQQLQPKEPKAQQLQPKEPKAQQLQPKEQKEQQLQPKEPKAQQLQPKEQKEQQLQSTEQKAQYMQPKEQKAQYMQPKEPKAQQLQPKEQKAQQLQPKEQKEQQLQSTEQKAQYMQPKEQKAQYMQPKEPKAQQLQPKEQKAQQLQPKEQKEQQLQSTEQKAQYMQPQQQKAQQLQPKEQKAQQLQPKEPKSQYMQPKEQKAQQLQPKEPKAQQLQPKEPKAQQLQPKEPKAQQLQPKEPKAQQLQPKEPKAQLQPGEQEQEQRLPGHESPLEEPRQNTTTVSNCPTQHDGPRHSDVPGNNNTRPPYHQPRQGHPRPPRMRRQHQRNPQPSHQHQHHRRFNENNNPPQRRPSYQPPPPIARSPLPPPPPLLSAAFHPDQHNPYNFPLQHFQARRHPGSIFGPLHAPQFRIEIDRWERELFLEQTRLLRFVHQRHEEQGLPHHVRMRELSNLAQYFIADYRESYREFLMGLGLTPSGRQMQRDDRRPLRVRDQRRASTHRNVVEPSSHTASNGRGGVGLTQQYIDDHFPSRLRSSGDSPTGGSHQCCICLADLLVGEEERGLPCQHTMHKQCIDLWLQNSVMCPVCRRYLRIP